jgi:hypothetical protein
MVCHGRHGQEWTFGKWLVAHHGAGNTRLALTDRCGRSEPVERRLVRDRAPYDFTCSGRRHSAVSTAIGSLRIARR